MTSPSRRKLPITRPSTRPWKSASAAGGLTLLFALAVPAAARCEDQFLDPIPVGAASPDNDPRSIAETGTAAAQRWARRSQRLRESAAPGSVTPGSVTPGSVTPGSVTPGTGTSGTGTPNNAAPNSAVSPIQTPGAAHDPTAGPSPAAAPQRVGARQAAPYPPQFFQPSVPVSAPAVAPTPQGGKRAYELKPEPSVDPNGILGPVESSPDANAKRPSQLQKVTQILPFYDYEPDPKIAREDPCLNLCPRPDGAPCKVPPGGRVPECPKEIKLAEGPYAPRSMPPSLFAWEASNVYYNPLYFEDAPLERYGHTYPCYIQPFVSAAKFSGQLLALPYQMTLDPCCRRVYPLGFYRPGECAPKKLYQIPWNTHAAAVQAGVTTGLIILIP